MTKPTALDEETLLQALERAQAALADDGSLLRSMAMPALRREAEALVLSALSRPRALLYQKPEQPLTQVESQRLTDWLGQRRLGVPLAYLTGQREFWSLSLTVTPDVLVPRPETELLVEQALNRGDELQRDLDRPVEVLELGTGSGAIVLALMTERPHWRYTATDISKAALTVAQRNAARLTKNQDHLCFVQGDWFAPLRRGFFDLIVSNPPYVAADDPCLLEDSLRHEPMLALTPGADALADLRHIIRSAREYLHPGGYLLLEHGAEQSSALQAELCNNGYTAHSHADLAGHWRISEGRLQQ